MSLRFLRCGCVLAAAMATVAQAQQVPQLKAISREWIQRGNSIEATISGENLLLATNILISGEPGISAAIVPTEAPAITIEANGGGITAITPADGKSQKIKISATAESPLGSRELRFQGPNGVSNPVTVNVGYLPEISENEDNNSIAQAQMVKLPAVISGRISASAQVDYFKFNATIDIPIIFDVNAARMGSKLDSSLAVLDKTGKELARNEDAKGLDSVLAFNAPADGEYILALRDFRYEGSGEHKYRITAGPLPYAEQAFPFGGERGRDVEVTLKGPNIEGMSKLTLHLDAKAPLGQRQLRATTSKGLSNPFLFDVSDLPQFTEKEPNSALDQADAVTLPVAINGRIQSEKDYDAYKFHGEEGQTWIFDVLASKFGSQLDALLTLTDGTGNIMVRNDDAGSADARIEYTFPKSGDYILIIEDLLHRGGENFAYRITARRPRQNFSVRCISDTPRIRRGGRVPIRCEVTRLTGFSDMVRIKFVDLPAGLFSEPLLLTPSDPAAGYIMLSATANAPLGTFPLKLMAYGEIDGKEVSRPVEIAEGDKLVKGGYLTILDQAPFTIEATTLASAIEQDQTGNIDVAVQRRNGFEGEIKLSVDGFSAGREPASKSFEISTVSLKGKESRGTLKLKTKLDSEIGTRPVVVRAETEMEGAKISEFSSPVAITTAQIPFTLKASLPRVTVTSVPAGSTSAAAEATFNVKIERRLGFDGEVPLTIEGVPAGVVATLDKIPAGAAEAPLKLVASGKAAVATNISLTISGSGTFKDRTFRQKAAPVLLTINAPEPVELKTADAKPLEIKPVEITPAGAK